MSPRAFALLLALAASGAALAQDVDPPSRVGRLSLVQGEVLLQTAEAGAPEPAELNRPLTISDRLITESASRAELSVGTAAVRLDEHTDLTIANLDHDIAQFELNSGTLGIHLRELGENETFEIDTPDATVLLLRPGDYRIEVDAEGATVLAVRNGEAELDGGAGATRLSDRQELRFAGPDQSASVASLGALSEFDEWCIERERIAEAQSPRYVSRDVVGYEDLDAYGSWSNEPGYGAVWAPRITIAHWSPYRFGRWAWISPWGYAWIDDSPWGFAPFHYGRWTHLRNRWCWVPPRHHRPVWAPALVAWNGPQHLRGLRQGDLRQGDLLRQGPVSWLPLGPRDVYVPGHRASSRYLRDVNVSNTTIARNADITNAARDRARNRRFSNRDVPGALTTMPASAFDADRAAGSQTRLATGGRMALPRVPTDRRETQANGDPRRRNYGVRAFERPPGKEPVVAGETVRERRAGSAEPRVRAEPQQFRDTRVQSRDTRAPRNGQETRSVPMARENRTSGANATIPSPPAARSTPAPRTESAAPSGGRQHSDSSSRSDARESRAQSGWSDRSTNRR